jgi:hypothetical protein
MAKQPPRSDAQDAAVRSARPKRAKTAGRQENEPPAAGPSQVTRETPAGEISFAGDRFDQPSTTIGEPAGADDRRSVSMGSEPSEEDIRLRAYHRYLERGGGHGMDFEDWLEAERELKKSR